MGSHQWAIKHENGTYFRGWCALGVYFGGTKENAMRFDSKEDADSVRREYSPRFMGSEFVFDGSRLIRLKSTGAEVAP